MAEHCPYDPADVPGEWPWEDDAWKCRDARANLVEAAALIWAAIDRIDQGGVSAARCVPTASGDEPATHFAPITRDHFAPNIPDDGPWLVRDDAGNRAAARWTGTMWAYASEDPAYVEQLDFEPSSFLPSHRARDGFVVEPVA